VLGTRYLRLSGICLNVPGSVGAGQSDLEPSGTTYSYVGTEYASG